MSVDSVLRGEKWQKIRRKIVDRKEKILVILY